jgi:hypothetical protein
MYTPYGGDFLTWVHDQIYAAGGEHIPQHWEMFHDQTGINAIVHLRPRKPAAFLGPMPSAFLWLDVEEESGAALEDRWLVGRFIDTYVRVGERILLHSSLTRHRVRWVFVAYRIYSGSSVTSTLREVAEKPWMDPYPTEEATWRAFRTLVESRQADPMR